MLQFYLLKYLKYEDLIKLRHLCKDAATLCDANTGKTEQTISKKIGKPT